MATKTCEAHGAHMETECSEACRKRQVAYLDQRLSLVRSLAPNREATQDSMSRSDSVVRLGLKPRFLCIIQHVCVWVMASEGSGINHQCNVELNITSSLCIIDTSKQHIMSHPTHTRVWMIKLLFLHRFIKI